MGFSRSPKQHVYDRRNVKVNSHMTSKWAMLSFGIEKAAGDCKTTQLSFSREAQEALHRGTNTHKGSAFAKPRECFCEMKEKGMNREKFWWEQTVGLCSRVNWWRELWRYVNGWSRTCSSFLLAQISRFWPQRTSKAWEDFQTTDKTTIPPHLSCSLLVSFCFTFLHIFLKGKFTEKCLSLFSMSVRYSSVWMGLA